jgi:hypothetical protein
MKIRKYVLAAAITILTFAFGVSVYTGVRMVASVLSSLAGREDVVAQQTVEPVQAEPLVKMKEIVPRSSVWRKITRKCPTENRGTNLMVRVSIG